MSENLDIMTQDAKGGYEKYLRSLKESMDSLVEETGRVASLLDGHDDNNFTRKLQGFLARLADNAIQSSGGIYEIVENFLRALEEKNSIVQSRAQDDYIQELRNAANELVNLKYYKDCDLASGGKPFTNEEEEDFINTHIVKLIDLWDDCVAELKRKSEELQGSEMQDEMSETFDLISTALERMVDNIADAVADANYHIGELHSNYDTRKQQFTQVAGDSSNDVQNAMRSILGDALEDFKNIVF